MTAISVSELSFDKPAIENNPTKISRLSWEVRLMFALIAQYYYEFKDFDSHRLRCVLYRL